MHYINEHKIGPRLRSLGLWDVRFRVGIDVGQVTIARVGIHGEGSHVAIGSTANFACKIMEFIPDGGICIGDKVYKNLPSGWERTCRKLENQTNYFYNNGKGQPYPAWILNHRLEQPI